MHRGRVAGRPALGAEPWQRTEPTRDLSGLALPAAVLDALRAVPEQFSERFWTSSPGDRRGVLLLFTGPSAADKAAAAEALAGELHLPLVRADLSGIFTRDRARSAQLQARLFATAQRLGAVVVLDGADGVLGAAAATGVTSVDRAELLRRSEAHPGIVVFPVEDAAAAASDRERFDGVIDFGLPDPAERTAIWRRALPDGAAVTEGDIAMLAGAFALPAAAIAECCASASALARADGAPLGRHHVGQALSSMYAGRPDADHVRAALAGLAQTPYVNGAAPSSPAPPAAPRLDTVPESAVRSARGGWYEPDAEPADVPLNGGPPQTEAAPAAVNGGPPVAAEAEPEAVQAEPEAVEAEPEPVEAEPEPVAAAPEPEPVGGAAEPPTEPVETAAEAPEIAPEAEPERERVAAVAERPTAARARPARAPFGPAWLRRPVPLALLGGLVAAVLGLNLAERKPTTSPTPIALNRTAAIGGARVTYPSNWAPRAAPSEPNLPLRHPVALTATSGAAVTLVLGMAPTSVAAPLPSRYIATQLPGTPTPQAVTLGTHRFERVLDPRLSLGGPAKTVYGLPTRTGTFVAICATRSTPQVARCEQVLATLQGVQPPHTVSAAVRTYLSHLDAILAGLNHSRATDGHALATARTAGAQAKAASALAAANGRAATAAGHLGARGALAAANGSLLGALRQSSGAYAALAAAASRGDARAYGAAQRSVAAATAAVDRALALVRAQTR